MVAEGREWKAGGETYSSPLRRGHGGREVCEREEEEGSEYEGNHDIMVVN